MGEAAQILSGGSRTANNCERKLSLQCKIQGEIPNTFSGSAPGFCDHKRTKLQDVIRNHRGAERNFDEGNERRFDSMRRFQRLMTRFSPVTDAPPSTCSSRCSQFTCRSREPQCRGDPGTSCYLGSTWGNTQELFKTHFTK